MMAGNGDREVQTITPRTPRSGGMPHIFPKFKQSFLAYLCQISSNYINFWHKVYQDDIIMYSALIYHYT